MYFLEKLRNPKLKTLNSKLANVKCHEMTPGGALGVYMIWIVATRWRYGLLLSGRATSPPSTEQLRGSHSLLR